MTDHGAWRSLGDDIYTFVQPQQGWGWSNAGLIKGAKSAAAVDSLISPTKTTEMLTAASQLLADCALSVAVITGPDASHHFGNSAFPRDLPIVSSEATAAAIAGQPIDRIFDFAKEDPHGRVHAYLAATLLPFKPRVGEALRPPDTVFNERHRLTISGREIGLHQLCESGEIAVHIPDADIVFAGELCRSNGTPAPWASSLSERIHACREILDLKPNIVVPGHGPPIGRLAVDDTVAFLTEVRNAATPLLEEGLRIDRVAEIISTPKLLSWTEAEWIVSHVAALHRDLRLADPWIAPQVLVGVAEAWHRNAQAGDSSLQVIHDACHIS